MSCTGFIYQQVNLREAKRIEASSRESKWVEENQSKWVPLNLSKSKLAPPGCCNLNFVWGPRSGGTEVAQTRPETPVHVHIYIYIYICLYVWMYICVYICMHVCMCLCVYVYICFLWQLCGDLLSGCCSWSSFTVKVFTNQEHISSVVVMGQALGGQWSPIIRNSSWSSKTIFLYACPSVR